MPQWLLRPALAGRGFAHAFDQQHQFRCDRPIAVVLPIRLRSNCLQIGAELPSAHQRYAAHATPGLIRSPGKLRDSMLDTAATAGSMKADAQSLPKWVVHDMSDVPPVATEERTSRKVRKGSIASV